MSNILWFRKKHGSYDPRTLPSKDTIVVIGHTPKCSRINQNLNLKNENGEAIIVHCVDGGITFGDAMLKYDGGSTVSKTVIMDHRNTAPQPENPKETIQEQLDFVEKYIKDIIISIFKSNLSLNDIYTTLGLMMERNDVFKRYNFIIDDKIKSIVFSDSMKKVIINYGLERGIITSSKDTREMTNAVIKYSNEVVFDYIISALIEKFGTKEKASLQMYGYLKTNDSEYITDSIRNARTLAEKLGINHLKQVIFDNGCTTVSAYVNKKFGKDKTLK